MGTLACQAYNWHGKAGMQGVLGARADQNIIRRQVRHLIQADLVAAMDLHLEGILTEHLHQVVCKGVVVINYQQRCTHGTASSKRKATQDEPGWL